MNNFWKLKEIQKYHEGWRMSILGGDIAYGYDKKFNIDKSKILKFGWKVEFFGEKDPRYDYGDRHISSHKTTLEEAIDDCYDQFLKIQNNL
jgi:hypothetical protein